MKTKTLLVLVLLLALSLARVSSQTLQKGAVVGLHTFSFTLNPDVTMNQVLDFFLTRYIPAADKNFPGCKMYMLTGDRGENKYKVAFLNIFENVQVRDKYYPTADKSSPEADAANAKMQPLMDELGKMVIDYTRVYTDWIVK